MTSMRRFMSLFEDRTTLRERLGNSFVDAAYGYWIAPEGQIHNVEKREGHVDALMDLEAFNFLSPSQPYYEWYDAALSSGWVRVIAPSMNHKQFNFQFKMLTPRTKRVLVNLIGGLPPYDLYVFEAGEYKTFDTQRDVLSFVRSFDAVVESLSTDTWTR